MSNDFFSFRRFCDYLRKLLTERWRTLAVTAAVLLGIMIIGEIWTAVQGYSIYLADKSFSSKSDNIVDILTIEASILFLVGGCIAASRQFYDGEKKAGRIHVLTTPVSTFESWLTRWVIFVPGYAVVFMACLYLADLLRYAVFAPMLPSGQVEIINLLNPRVFKDGMYPHVWQIYFFVTSWFALGSYFFPKRPLMSTAVCMFIIALVFFFVIISGVAEWFVLNDRQTGILQTTAWIWIGLHTLLNWWLSYQRLKEMEVIDRH